MGKQFIKVYKHDFNMLSESYDHEKEVLSIKKQNKLPISLIDKPVNMILELTVLSMMRDRMKSSMKNPNFVNKVGRAFVIMTYDEITTKLHCSVRSCNHVLKDLEKLGLIMAVKQYKTPSKYYIQNGNFGNQGYYEFYNDYLSDFHGNLKLIYTYMLLKDFAAMSERETNKVYNTHNFMDDDGKYFVAKNISDLSKHLKLSQPTSGKLIQQLELAGYIKRQRRRNKVSRIYVLK